MKTFAIIAFLSLAIGAFGTPVDNKARTVYRVNAGADAAALEARQYSIVVTNPEGEDTELD